MPVREGQSQIDRSRAMRATYGIYTFPSRRVKCNFFGRNVSTTTGRVMRLLQPCRSLKTRTFRLELLDSKHGHLYSKLELYTQNLKIDKKEPSPLGSRLGVRNAEVEKRECTFTGMATVHIVRARHNRCLATMRSDAKLLL